jgi:hypothetical protein
MRWLACLFITTIASQADAQSMNVHLKNGRTTTIPLAQIERITYTAATDATGGNLRGTWIGTVTQVDVNRRRRDFAMRLDLDRGIARSGGCPNPGRVRVISSNQFEVTWPNCGTETVNLTFQDGVLTGQGQLQPTTGTRFTTFWRVSQQ